MAAGACAMTIHNRRYRLIQRIIRTAYPVLLVDKVRGLRFPHKIRRRHQERTFKMSRISKAISPGAPIMRGQIIEAMARPLP